MHPIPGKVRRGHGGGSLRVFRQFAWLGVGYDKMALSRPAHQRVTHTVGRNADIGTMIILGISTLIGIESEDHHD